MTFLWWLWEKVRAAVSVVPDISIPGSDDTALSTAGSNDTELSIAGSDDTSISIIGSSTVALEKHISFHSGETYAVEVTGVTMTGKTVVGTITHAGTGAVLAQSTATISGGLPTVTWTATQTLDIPSGSDIGKAFVIHDYDIACTTSGSEAVLVYGKATVRISPSLQN